jgi:hypothetical protein
MIKKYLATALVFAFVGTAHPVMAADTVRPEVGKPVQAALDLLKAKKSKDALAKIHDAEGVANKTPYEAYLVERVKAQAYLTAGDGVNAAKSFENAAGMPGAPAAEKNSLLTAAAGQYYSARDYAKAAALASKFPQDPSMRTIYVQSLYLGGDFAGAAKALSADIREAEQAKRKPSEESLQMLTQAYLKQKDQVNYGKAIEKLLAYYPKKEYWQSVIYDAKQNGAMADRLALDLARLQRATGTLHTAQEYEDAVALALQQGFPIEAKKIFDEGMAAKIMGQGNQADRHRRLGEMAAKAIADDNKQLGSEDAAANASNDGSALVNLGYNYVLHDQADKGLAMMEAGIKKGGMKRPEDAKLHLGYAYYMAGKKAKATQAFKSVSGSDGAAALAGLWTIVLSQG